MHTGRPLQQQDSLVTPHFEIVLKSFLFWKHKPELVSWFSLVELSFFSPHSQPVSLRSIPEGELLSGDPSSPAAKKRRCSADRQRSPAALKHRAFKTRTACRPKVCELDTPAVRFAALRLHRGDFSSFFLPPASSSPQNNTTPGIWILCKPGMVVRRNHTVQKRRKRWIQESRWERLFI